MTQCIESPAEAVVVSKVSPGARAADGGVGRWRGWRILRWQVSEPQQVRPVVSPPTVGELLVRLDPFLAAR
ncbi:hypothetical protein [Nocardia terpenica]|uniref:Uncharacterized protein n=1 Tax=Nocardia terpenica TaxID=455432 RepID=A0A6G9Z7S5_9NOCA|nr:hypothetical protein [Nocardia terpenica]QIS21542.1 hypothetical protein F6W96_27610 [Nocardia terpenica]